jgi:hypothetical protein
MILGQFSMLKKINLTSKIFMVEGGKKIKIKFYFIFVNFLRGGHRKCPKINFYFYFHFVVFLRGRLKKQVIIKVWPLLWLKATNGHHISLENFMATLDSEAPCDHRSPEKYSMSDALLPDMSVSEAIFRTNKAMYGCLWLELGLNFQNYMDRQIEYESGF